MPERGVSLLETIVAGVVISVLATMVLGAAWKVYSASSSAVAAHTLTQLSVAGQSYLAENNHVFWPYRYDSKEGTQYFFGFESRESSRRPEGQREVDLAKGPLGPYIGASCGRRPDPSFLAAGKTLKNKFRNLHFAYGYNWLLDNNHPRNRYPIGGGPPRTVHALRLPNPGQTVVFATSAQVNTFQAPASASNPMLEEFYMFDDQEFTIHFRIGGKAMVAFADGSLGFLPMEESTRDMRAPKANIGRFAPRGSRKYLE